MNIVLQFLLIFGFVISLFLTVGLVLWYRAKRFIAGTHQAEGVVLKVKAIPFDDRETFTPVVRFTTSDGRSLSFTDPVSRFPAEFKVGDKTQVLYDPKNPHNARAVRQVSDLFLAAKIFATAGFALLGMVLLAGMSLSLFTHISFF
jgi:hypothetical protein